MQVLTLSYTSSLDPLTVQKQQFSLDEIFSTSNYAKTITFNNKTLDLNYVNDLLVIQTEAAIDIFININSAPLVGIYVNTNGSFVIKGAQDLDLGILVFASYIKINNAITTHGFIGLNTQQSPDGEIIISKKVTTNKLGIITNSILNESNVSTDTGLIYCKEFIQEKDGSFSMGGSITSTLNPTQCANNDALSLWNNISAQDAVKNLLPEVRYICTDIFTNKSNVKLCKTEFHIQKTLEHSDHSITTYDQVRIFNKGQTTVSKFATINGNDSFLQSEDINIEGAATINKFAIVSKKLNVMGTLDGVESIDLNVNDFLTCSGNITADNTNITSNNILVSLNKNNINSAFEIFSKGGISGKKTLNTHSVAITLAAGGYLHSPNLYVRCGSFVNILGALFRCDLVLKTVFSINQGLNLPCHPNNAVDYFNPEKFLRLAHTIIGASFPALQAFLTFGTLAKTVGSISINVAKAVYEDPYAQMNKVKNNVKYGAKAVSDKAHSIGSGAVNAGINFVKAPSEQLSKTKESIKSSILTVSETWNNTKMIEWLDFILSAHDWYIFGDMIATKGTNLVVFAHEAKISLQNPSQTLENIKNNLAKFINNANSELFNPQSNKNIFKLIDAELNKAINLPAKATQKIASQIASAAEFGKNVIVDPMQVINVLKQSGIDAINTIDPIRASNTISKRWTDRVNTIRNIGNSQTNKTTFNLNNYITPKKTTHSEKGKSSITDMFYESAMIWAPSDDRRSLFSIDAGITISGSVMEESLLSSHNGITMAIGTSSNVLFGYHNSGGIYSRYRNEIVGHRYNTGDTHADIMYLETFSNNESGDFNVSKKLIFDVKNKFTLEKGANFNYPENTIANIQEFVGYGDINIDRGQFTINKYTVAPGANHTIKGSTSFYAKDIDVQGSLAINEAKPTLENTIVRENASYSNHNSTHQGNALTFEPGAKCDLKNDIINVTKLNDNGAIVNVENHVTVAKEIHRDGQWQYKGFMHEETDFLSTAKTSYLKDTAQDDVYSLHAKKMDLQGQEQHSKIIASVDDLSADDIVNYALGTGQYEGIGVTKNIFISSQTTETITYTGDRANGARVLIQTKGAIVLPSKFTRARDLTFSNYTEADIFVRAIYDSYNLPPPPPIKRHGFKKFWGDISKAFGTASALFATGGLNPITLTASAVCSAVAFGADKADKHYDRKQSRELERRELENLRLRQQSENAALSLQEEHALHQLEVEEHYERINDMTNKLYQNDTTQSTMPTSFEKRENLLQEVSEKRTAVNDKYKEQMTDVAYYHARRRDAISKSGGPVIGIGGSVQFGSTGVNTYVTLTAGNRGETSTGKLLLTSYEFSRSSEPQAYYTEKFPRVLPTITEIVEDEDTIEFAPLSFSETYLEKETFSKNTPDSKSKKSTPILLNSDEKAFSEDEVIKTQNKSGSTSQNSSIEPSSHAYPEKESIAKDANNIPKSKFDKILDFWKDLDDGMQATEYYERPGLGKYEIKVLAGTTVGAVEAGVYIPYKMTNTFLASLEEFDNVFNPEFLSETHDQDRKRLIYKYQAQRDSIGNGFSFLKNAAKYTGKALYLATSLPLKITFKVLSNINEFENVFNPEVLTSTYEQDRDKILSQHQMQNDELSKDLSEAKQIFIVKPATVIFSIAYHAGEKVFNLANTPEELAFSAGIRLGETAVNSRYLFFSAQSAAFATKRIVYSEYRMPIIRTKDDGYTIRTFMRPKGIHLEPTTILEGWRKNDYLSKFDMLNPVPLTWEQRDIVAFYMYHRYQLLKELASIDTKDFKYLKAKKLLNSAMNQVHDHMQPKDLCGYLKEKNGVKIIRKNRKADHEDEYEGAVKSMKNIQNLRYSKLNEEEIQTIEKAKPIIAKAWELYNKLRETDKLDSKQRIKLKSVQ